jgi:hypothetical protein
MEGTLLAEQIVLTGGYEDGCGGDEATGTFGEEGAVYGFDHFGGCLEAVVWLFLEAGVHEPLCFGGQVAAATADGPGWFVDLLVEDGDGFVGIKGADAGEEFVEDDAQGVDVGTAVQG